MFLMIKVIGVYLGQLFMMLLSVELILFVNVLIIGLKSIVVNMIMVLLRFMQFLVVGVGILMMFVVMVMSVVVMFVMVIVLMFLNFFFVNLDVSQKYYYGYEENVGCVVGKFVYYICYFVLLE